jgi:hypothetical protein
MVKAGSAKGKIGGGFGSLGNTRAGFEGQNPCFQGVRSDLGDVGLSSFVKRSGRGVLWPSAAHLKRELSKQTDHRP